MFIWQSHSGGAFAPRKFACLHKQLGRKANRDRFDATCNLPREGPWNPEIERQMQAQRTITRREAEVRGGHAIMYERQK